jgi:hypothetical protein
MFARSFKFAALTAAAWLALPFGIAAAQETEAAPPTGQSCGGFAGLACPEGYTCVDDPRDDCNTKTGGADCSGIFICEPGYEHFFSDCGCGCQLSPQ